MNFYMELKKMIKHLFLLLFLSACGEVEYNDVPEGMTVYNLGDNSSFLFEDYLEEFLQEAANRGINLSDKKIKYYLYNDWIHGENIVGVCHNGSKVMGFKTSMITAGDIYTRKSLVFHEAGHCLLGLGHTKSGLMHKHLDVGSQALRDDFEGTLDEVFNLYKMNINAIQALEELRYEH